nr:hypothetical protein [Escherichia coli]
MKFNLSNLSAVLLASGMLMSTAVTATPAMQHNLVGRILTGAPLIIRAHWIWMTTLIQWGENPLYWPCSESYL